jgi:hypothetical protein
LTPAEGSLTSPTSLFAHSRETSLSAQSTPVRTSRPVSEEVALLPSSTPRALSKAVSEFPPVPSSPSPQVRSIDFAATTSSPQLPIHTVRVTPTPKPEVSAEASQQVPPSPTTSPPRFSVRTNLTSTASITSHTPITTDKSVPYPSDMTSPRPLSSGQNGTNGVLSPPMSPKALFRTKGRLPSFTSSRAPSHNFSTTMRTYTKRTGGGGSHKIGLVQESAAALKRRSMSELGAGVYQSVSNVSYVNFLEWIRSERLTTLPHKGK